MKRWIAAVLAAGLCMMTACSGGGEEAVSSSQASSPAPEAAGDSAGQEEAAPPEPEAFVWQVDSPENHNMDPAVFDQLHAALDAGQVYAMLTVKDRVIIDEYYQDGYGEDSVYPLHSASKSFTGALFGIALEEGYFDSVDDPLYEYLPQVLEEEDTRKQQITLRHLLTQTSGLEWYEWGGSYSNWNEFQSAPNWVDYILGRSLVAEPGTLFNYSTGNTPLIAAALEAATGMSELEYGREKLFDPMGMESVTWHTDPQGVTDGGNGIAMTVRDAARFGQLFLQNGEWQGQQLVPAQWVEASTTAQNSGAGDGTGSYGYQWWIRNFGGIDTYYAFGAWGQYIIVVPELDLVTVIASPGPQNSYTSRGYFVDYVLAAYEG